MRLREIQDSDDSIWKLISPKGNSFYIDYEKLKRKYMLFSSSYDNSTDPGSVKDTIEEIRSMMKTISDMHKFCKNSQPDTETEEFIKGLILMYNSCKEMITELKRFL